MDGGQETCESFRGCLALGIVRPGGPAGHSTHWFQGGQAATLWVNMFERRMHILMGTTCVVEYAHPHSAAGHCPLLYTLPDAQQVVLAGSHPDLARVVWCFKVASSQDAQRLHESVALLHQRLAPAGPAAACPGASPMPAGHPQTGAQHHVSAAPADQFLAGRRGRSLKDASPQQVQIVQDCIRAYLTDPAFLGALLMLMLPAHVASCGSSCDS